MNRTKQLTFALLVCLVLVLAYQLIDLNRLNQNRSVLNERIAAGTSTLGLLSGLSSDNSSRLAEVYAEYQSVLQGVSQKSVPTQVIKMLLELTDRFKFEVNPITTEQWSKRSIGKAIYQVLPVNLSLNGNLTDIIGFIQDLEDENRYPNLEIESTRIVTHDSDNLTSSSYDTNLQIRILVIERLTTSE
jgi:Tfp pilus assembly protein PilO